MNIESIFALQFFLSTLVAAVLARWYLTPWLQGKPLQLILSVLIAPHAFRHLGMAFLVPGLTSETLPAGFAIAAAYGDLISGFLAITTLVALQNRWRSAIPLAWIFSIFGIGDLTIALSHAEAIPHLGTAWLIPTFVVPGLLVTHWLVLVQLIGHAGRKATSEVNPFGKKNMDAAHAS
ncbi:MAG: hypothetical protein ACPGXK_05675 [Phycisphaerae bacterium]